MQVHVRHTLPFPDELVRWRRECEFADDGLSNLESVGGKDTVFVQTSLWKGREIVWVECGPISGNQP